MKWWVGIWERNFNEWTFYYLGYDMNEKSNDKTLKLMQLRTISTTFLLLFLAIIVASSLFDNFLPCVVWLTNMSNIYRLLWSITKHKYFPLSLIIYSFRFPALLLLRSFSAILSWWNLSINLFISIAENLVFCWLSLECVLMTSGMVNEILINERCDRWDKNCYKIVSGFCNILFEAFIFH